MMKKNLSRSGGTPYCNLGLLRFAVVLAAVWALLRRSGSTMVVEMDHTDPRVTAGSYLEETAAANSDDDTESVPLDTDPETTKSEDPAQISAKESDQKTDGGTSNKEQSQLCPALLRQAENTPTFYSYSLTVRNAGAHDGLCPDTVRAGDARDGGWWVCDAETWQQFEKCVVYSFGINDNFSFDQFLAQKGCAVHGFDPSPAGLQSRERYETVPNAHYHDFGLGFRDQHYGPGEVPMRWPGMDYLRDTNTLPWNLKRLPTIVSELGHANQPLTILKIDTEGAEWDTLTDIASASWEELYLELHFPPGEYAVTGESNGDMVVTRLPPSKQPDKGVEKHPAQNSPGPIDRIALLQKITAIADMFQWTVNTDCVKLQAACIEIYFKRKKIQPEDTATTNLRRGSTRMASMHDCID